MRVEVQIAKGKWRSANATINALGHAVVKLKHPYEPAIFKVWRKVKPNVARGK